MPEDVITQSQPQSDAHQSGYPAEGSREMMDAGVFYGRKKSKTNPKMKQFVLANRGGIEIINLQKTEDAMEHAAGFVKEKIRNGGTALFVGAVPSADAKITELAKKYGFPYVTARWVGGTITNFRNISKRIEYMKKLRTDFATHALDKYTKKERLELEKEQGRLEELIGGLEMMSREPDLLVIIDPVLHDTAVREAIVKKIPVVALGNVDVDPDLIDHLVPGNDKAKLSIEWFLGKIDKAIEEGLKEKAAKVAEDAAKKEKEAAVKDVVKESPKESPKAAE
jgi:small subunit ribosomal protein S2